MQFERSCPLPVPATEAMAWHARPRAFDRLLPPWEAVEVDGPPRGLELGQEILLKIQQGPIRLGWLARIAALESRRFVDEQVRGPFARWRHEHRFEPEGDGSTCRLVDAIEFETDYVPSWPPESHKRLLFDSPNFRFRSFTFTHCTSHYTARIFSQELLICAKIQKKKE